jgi:hypothetical protein
MYSSGVKYFGHRWTIGFTTMFGIILVMINLRI